MTTAITTLTQRRLDEAAVAARRRANQAQGTALHEMTLALADAASDRADGYRAACEALETFPGPIVAQVVSALLRVTPDPEDSSEYDAGFRAGLRAALP